MNHFSNQQKAWNNAAGFHVSPALRSMLIVLPSAKKDGRAAGLSALLRLL
ncbi:MAG: hypothetical protein WC124_14690 [Desulfoplanes sp.]